MNSNTWLGSDSRPFEVYRKLPANAAGAAGQPPVTGAAAAFPMRLKVLWGSESVVECPAGGESSDSVGGFQEFFAVEVRGVAGKDGRQPALVPVPDPGLYHRRLPAWGVLGISSACRHANSRQNCLSVRSCQISTITIIPYPSTRLQLHILGPQPSKSSQPCSTTCEQSQSAR
jgi:hypothetical protein